MAFTNNVFEDTNTTTPTSSRNSPIFSQHNNEMVPSILRCLPTPLRRVHKTTKKKLRSTQTRASSAKIEPDRLSAMEEGYEQLDDFDKVENEELDALLEVDEWDLVERVDIGYKRSGFSAYDRGLREDGKHDEVKWVMEDGKLVGSVQ